MRILITGAAGFVGGWMADLLCRRQPEAEIFGLVRQRRRPALSSLQLDAVQWVPCDLEDASATTATIAQIRPSVIYHLAAQSSVPAALEAPAATLAANILGQVNLLEAVRTAGLDSVIVIAGSSEAYGLAAATHVPITESAPFLPTNPYAVSKATQDLLGWQYYQAYGLRIVRMRPFNHSGPGRGDGFVESSFARQIARIEAGLVPPVLYVGNLDACRDFTDVRDVTEAYLAASMACSPGEAYNVASGVSRPIRTVLEQLLALSSARIEVALDANKLRPSDVPIVRGDASKLTATCGWTPRIAFEQTLEELLEYWRARERP
jgi:GDP-4-dehydro-6-deoxy-D-mannose reductase